MTHIQKAIEDAVRGGYKTYECSCEATESNPEGVCHNCGTDLPCAPIEKLIIEPLFWQCLGKERKWKTELLAQYWKDPSFHSTKPTIETWWANWHRLIDHLASGKDIESFFESISITK